MEEDGAEAGEEGVLGGTVWQTVYSDLMNKRSSEERRERKSTGEA